MFGECVISENTRRRGAMLELTPVPPQRVRNGFALLVAQSRLEPALCVAVAEQCFSRTALSRLARPLLDHGLDETHLKTIVDGVDTMVQGAGPLNDVMSFRTQWKTAERSNPARPGEWFVDIVPTVYLQDEAWRAGQSSLWSCVEVDAAGASLPVRHFRCHRDVTPSAFISAYVEQHMPAAPAGLLWYGQAHSADSRLFLGVAWCPTRGGGVCAKVVFAQNLKIVPSSVSKLADTRPTILDS